MNSVSGNVKLGNTLPSFSEKEKIKDVFFLGVASHFVSPSHALLGKGNLLVCVCFCLLVSRCIHVCQSISPSRALIKRPSLPFPACLCSHSRPPSSSPRSPLAHGYMIVKNVFTKLALSQIKPHANQRLGERKREEGREGCV